MTEQKGASISTDYNIIVDSSHRYTDVLTDGYRGPGGSHHNYRIVAKGGYTLRYLNFQDGPIKESGVNGIMDENLLAVVIDRLKGFQTGPYACQENGEALIHVQAALDVLKLRTQRRITAGVEGTHQVAPGEGLAEGTNAVPPQQPPSTCGS